MVPGTQVDRQALDRVERGFWAEIFESTDAEAAAEHGMQTRRFGPVQATVIADLPRSRFLNLLLGAGEPGGVEPGCLRAAVEWADSLGVDYYVPVTPELPESDSAMELLAELGLVRGYAWMKFVRDASSLELPEPEGLEIVELGAGEGEPFGAIAAKGFGLPEWAAGLFGGLPGREGWRCYLVSIEGRAAACAAMRIEGPIAEFGIAATNESARGRGCQQALLRRRIADAAAAGCEQLFVETGERSEDRPSASYRNILRAGFEEAYLRPNWQRPASR
jgi:GNAT superfamily N-acetyltransferase